MSNYVVNIVAHSPINERSTLHMFCAEIVETLRLLFTSFHIFKITLGEDVTFPLIT